MQSLEPWFYEFDLGPLGHTKSLLSPEVLPIHSTRLTMLNGLIDRHFEAARLNGLSCLDVACHEGFYAVEVAKRGLRRIVGVDVREESLRKARTISQILNLDTLEFRKVNAEQLDPDVLGSFDITLFLGLLYHLENPMLCLRRVSAVTKELCVIETQVIDEVKGSTEWGAQCWTRPYRGVMAVIDETSEFDAGNRETGATPLALCPSRDALVTMLRHSGFSRVEFLEPPPGAYEQIARGKRVMCAAYKG